MLDACLALPSLLVLEVSRPFTLVDEWTSVISSLTRTVRLRPRSRALRVQNVTEALERRLEAIQSEMRASAQRAARPRERKASAPPSGSSAALGVGSGLPTELVSSALRSVRFVQLCLFPARCHRSSNQSGTKSIILRWFALLTDHRAFF